MKRIELKGKYIWITGASLGIGSSLARYIIKNHPMKKWRRFSSIINSAINFFPNLINEKVRSIPRGVITNDTYEEINSEKQQNNSL